VTPLLETLLGITAAVTVGLTTALVLFKIVHREYLRWRGVRSAHYVAAIGEMVSRRMVPERTPPGWAGDPAFHDALAEYRLLLTGSERQLIDDLAARSGVLAFLVHRSRRRFPIGSRLRAVVSLADLATSRQRHHLRLLMQDRHAHVRVNAVRGLARMGDFESAGAILDQAVDAEPWEAARLSDSLVAMGVEVVAPTCQWIESRVAEPEPPTRVIALACRALGVIGDPTAEATLIRLLSSSEPTWRVAAASALETVGGTASVEPLLDALDDRESRVRARATVALGASAEPRAARPVAGLLYDPVWWVRQNAARALGDIPGGTDHLLAAVAGPDPYAADAALHQLTLSGVLREAMERVRSGRGSDRDHLLASALTA